VTTLTNDDLTRLRASLVPLDAAPAPVAGAPEGGPPRRGAVMVLLYPRHRETHLVLERRPADLPQHAGQISLPGGGYREGDGDDLGTARRELQEELGVTPDRYQAWGRLEPLYIPASNFAVVPFVGYAQRPPIFRPNSREVAEVLEVPLRALADPATLEEEVWELRGAPRRVSFYRHGEHKIWGATARVLGQIGGILRHEPWHPDVLAPGLVVPWP
jgi:8-oxo-dGTP pyrophosphatase MutT (NUDIX family)